MTTGPNEVLHGWLEEELSSILAALPPASVPGDAVTLRSACGRWQEGLLVKPTLAAELPPLRMLLVLDNLVGHKDPAFVLWLFSMGVMPLHTPLGGSWLNMVESLQRIPRRRALEGSSRGRRGRSSAGSRRWRRIGTGRRRRPCGAASGPLDGDGNESGDGWVDRVLMSQRCGTDR